MLKLIGNLIGSCISTIRMYNAFHNKKYRKEVLSAEIIRNVHSLEKGLCLSNPKRGWGEGKITTLIRLMQEYLNEGYPCENTVIYMGCCAAEEYFEYHNKCHYTSDNLSHQCELLTALKKQYKIFPKEQYGGTLAFDGGEYFSSPSEASLLSVLNNRHSIRAFSSEPVNIDVLNEAIRLACKCPSACNRQTTRVYVAGKEKITTLKNFLSGIGGFVDSVDKFLIITGKMSSFNDGEIYQHIVNASIFTAYLSLTLTANNIGSCVVQRPLLYSRQWRRFAKANNIPDDENLVCMMAIGNYLKSDFKVPVSYRFPIEHIVKIL